MKNKVFGIINITFGTFLIIVFLLFIDFTGLNWIMILFGLPVLLVGFLDIVAGTRTLKGKNWRWSTIILSILALAYFIPMAFAAGGPFGDWFIGFRGTVYEWKDAPLDTESEIYIIDDAEYLESIDWDLQVGTESILKKKGIDTKSIVPLKGAVVTVKRKNILEIISRISVVPVYEANSGENGEVKYFSATGPWNENLSVEVAKAGYSEIEGEANLSSIEEFIIVAILAKK